MVLNFKFRQDGQLAAFTNQDGFLKILNVKQKKVFKEIRVSDTPIYGLDIIQDKPIVAFGNDQGDLFAYNFAAQMQISHFPKINKDFL